MTTEQTPGQRRTANATQARTRAKHLRWVAELATVLDGKFALSGDEGGGVSLECRPCDTGGRPIAHHGWTNPYGPDVEDVTTISGLLRAAINHRCEESS